MSVDYKEKIKVGHKRIEQSWVFRKLKLRNCLGIVMQFHDRKKYVFDVVTNVSNQTALLSKCIMKHVLHRQDVMSKFAHYNIKQLFA